jgi:hypothetical protein
VPQVRPLPGVAGDPWLRVMGLLKTLYVSREQRAAEGVQLLPPTKGPRNRGQNVNVAQVKQWSLNPILRTSRDSTRLNMSWLRATSTGQRHQL